jgi:hypothetical protein
MEELFYSEQFKKYRLAMLSVFGEYVRSRLFGDESDLKEIRGALEIMRQIIRLPNKIRQTDFTRQMVNEDLRRFEVEFIKSGLQSDPEQTD